MPDAVRWEVRAVAIENENVPETKSFELSFLFPA